MTTAVASREVQFIVGTVGTLTDGARGARDRCRAGAGRRRRRLSHRGAGPGHPRREGGGAGGTSLTRSGSSRGWTETVWGSSLGGEGTGSGCSQFEGKPSFQTHKGCSHRIDNDVAAVADPNTGVAVYDTYDQGGWLIFGGTSVASPLIASVYALAGNGSSVS